MVYKKMERKCRFSCLRYSFFSAILFIVLSVLSSHGIVGWGNNTTISTTESTETTAEITGTTVLTGSSSGTIDSNTETTISPGHSTGTVGLQTDTTMPSEHSTGTTGSNTETTISPGHSTVEPEFVSYFPSEITAIEHQSFKLVATVKTKDEKMAISWRRNGTQINVLSFRRLQEQVNSVSLTETNFSLIVNNANLSDGGLWTFALAPKSKTIIRSCYVTVLPAPKIQLSESNINTTERSNFSLTCFFITDNLSAVPVLPVLTWTKDGILVGKEIKIKIEETHSTTRSIIIKENATIEDTGEYCCNISIYGRNNCAMVTVLEGDKGCPYDIDKYGIIWSSSPSKSIVYNSCGNGKEGNASRRCDEEQWSTTDLSNCYDSVYESIFHELSVLKKNTSTEVVESTLNSTIKTVMSITKQNDTIIPEDLPQIMSVLNTVVDVAENFSASIEEEDVFEIVDDLIAAENEKSWMTAGMQEENNNTDISSVLIFVDNVVDFLWSNNSNTSYSGNNFVISSEKLNHRSDIFFPEPNGSNSYLVLKAQNNSQPELKYAGVLYKTISGLLEHLSKDSNEELYQTKNDTIAVNSEILSLRVEDPPDTLSPPIVLTFPHNNKTAFSPEEAKCVFWDFSLGNGSGEWSTAGCRVRERTADLTTCECNHLTNFAVLMRPYRRDAKTKEPFALILISQLGCIVSIAFCTLTIIFYVAVWRHIRSDVNVLIISLCLSIIVGFSLFLSNGGDDVHNEMVCMIRTAALHYFLLVMFFVMFTIGLYYFTKVTVTYYSLSMGSRLSQKLNSKFFISINMGVPLIISVGTVVAYWNEEYHLSNFCWLSITRGALYTFIVPALIVITINVFIVMSLLHVLFHSEKMKHSDLKIKAVTGLRSFGTQLPVLGVAWIFGILAVNDNAVTFQFIFAIANSLQGLFIFLFHVVLNKKVKEGLQKRFAFSSVPTTDKTMMKSVVPHTTEVTGQHIVHANSSDNEHKAKRKSKRDTIMNLISAWKNKPE